MNKVCVIGSGIAGISAAEYLIENGLTVDIYETSPNIGGRVTSVKDAKTNEMIDNGQHLLVGAYKRFLALIDKFGTSDRLKYQPSLKINYLSKDWTDIKFDSTKFPGIFGQLFGILNFNVLTFADKLSLIKIAYILKKLKVTEDISCYRFLKSYNQSDNLILYFWEPLILATINNDIHNAPAQLLVKILQDAFFNDAKSGSLIFPKTDLGSLMAPFIDYINKNNSDLYLKTGVQKLIVDNNKATGILLKSGETKYYENIISCIPPYALKKILPESLLNDEFSYLEKFQYSPILSVYLWYDSNPLDEDIYALINTKSQWIFNKRNFSKKSNDIPCLLSVTISNAVEFNNISPSEIVKIINNEIRSLLNNFNAELIHSRVIKEKMATFRADLETEHIRPDADTNIAGLYLAGDWTNTGYPATIEGAAISGVNAAEQIIAKII